MNAILALADSLFILCLHARQETVGAVFPMRLQVEAEDATRVGWIIGTLSSPTGGR